MALRLVREPAPGMLFLRSIGQSSQTASALGRNDGVLVTPRPNHQVAQ